MSKPRKKPTNRYHALLVEPASDFCPTNWQDKPQDYQILEYLGAKRFHGRADAWRFLHNHEALEKRETNIWAIYVN